MNSKERRVEILSVLNADTPTKAAALAQRCQVSRQVIVQDVAMLRAAGKDILSTPRGYMLRSQPQCATRVFACSHTGEQKLSEELFAIVYRGGHVLDVMVEHPVYGEISVPLMLRCVADVEAFVEMLRDREAQPLASVTGGYHMHTVTALNEQALVDIERALQRVGVLVQPE